MYRYRPCGPTLTASAEGRELSIALTPFKVGLSTNYMIGKWAITTTDGEVFEVGRTSPSQKPLEQKDAENILDAYIQLTF